MRNGMLKVEKVYLWVLMIIFVLVSSDGGIIRRCGGVFGCVCRWYIGWFWCRYKGSRKICK